MSKEAYDIPADALNEQAGEGGLQILHEGGPPPRPEKPKPVLRKEGRVGGKEEKRTKA